MSEAPNMASWGERIAGKWQIPLFVFSLLMLGGSVFLTRPTPKVLSLAESITSLESLVGCGLNDRAIEFGLAILKHPDCTPERCAPVNLNLARARYARAVANPSSLVTGASKILADYRRATSYGQTLNAQDFESVGRLRESQNDFAGAIEAYENALKAGTKNGTPLRKRIAYIARRHLGCPPEVVLAKIDDLLESMVDDELDTRFWAIEEKLDMLEELGRLHEAKPLVESQAEKFAHTDHELEIQYLKAWVLHKNNEQAGAEALLRAIRNQVGPENNVHAMSGWLLGRVILAAGDKERAAEALSFFEDVIRYHRAGAYRVASRIGRAESLVLLDRNEDALASYKLAIDELRDLEEMIYVYRNVLRTSLAVSSEAERSSGRLRNALAYAELAMELVDRDDAVRAPVIVESVAELQASLASEIVSEFEGNTGRRDDHFRRETPEESRELYTKAGASYLELSKVDRLNEGRASDALWLAAEMFAAGANYARAIELFHAYMEQRPDDAKGPRACLRIAQLQQAQGRVSSAIATYRECYDRFPKTLDGARALVPLAQCYLATGPENYEKAEAALDLVLEDSDVFTPQAPEFADALFLLGEARARRGDHEGTLSTFAEAIARYPNDPRVIRSRYLLANAYRNSALELKKQVANSGVVGDTANMMSEAKARLMQAKELYHALVAELDGPALALNDPISATYLRHAMLYEADCLFESGQYEQAIGLYEEAAGAYRDEPAALAAYVQIISCDVFLGRSREARVALARAIVLTNAMPEHAFLRSLSGEKRSDWQAYFDWLSDSELF